MLHGFVFDPALRPLDGATVKVLDTNASTATDPEGFFGFGGLPVEQFLVVVATKDGFVPMSKQVTLVQDTPIRLNFTLEPEPTQVAYSVPIKQDMLVECQAGVELSQQQQAQSINCGSGTREIDTWDIAVDVALAGAVVEVFWDASTPAAESMGAKLETLELGQLNLVLGEVVGTSPLRIMVPQSTAERYYPEGGLMRLTIFARPNTDENEAGIGASVLVEQQVEAFATLFYVQPPDPTYTISNAG